ncbi:MAG TPA: NAD(P)-dependent oxidoreductase [Novimethylophilus sp.]|jgi:UDP-glucose 4-epimerase|uniref:NAD-dependent epimerase/dehydratase family protein n=1 Tax=Novimethylophilus sp. TaxID=2137426 RepID=UPI002F425030
MTEVSSPDHKRKVVVIGHTGFIGRSLVECFRNAFPDLEVLTPPRIDLSRAEEAARLAPWLTTDSIVVLCAAVKKQLGDSLDIFSTNLRVTENLCRMLEKHPPARVVYFSSASVYGEGSSNLDITESTAINPSTYYGVGKYCAEELLKKTLEHTRTSLLILRAPLIYGTGDKSRGYGPTGFVWNALYSNGDITLWGGGEELREFVFIDDAARIACELALHGYAGVVNIATGTSHSFREILDCLAQHAPLAVTSKPRSKPRVDQAYRNRLLRELLPGAAFTSLHEGIARLLADFSLEETA